METSSMYTAHQILVTFAVLLAAGTIVGKAADYLRVPDVVCYLLAGMLIGPAGMALVTMPAGTVINQLVLILGSSVLLFHGGISVKIHILKTLWRTLFLLSTLAVILTVAIVGYTVHVVFGIGLISALLLGAVLAPTDPATLIPIFLSVGVKERLAQTVVSESAFNDATGAIITFTIIDIMATGQFTAGAVLQNFVTMAGGGMLIGGGYGLLAGYLISGKSGDVFAEFAQVLMLPVIIAAYLTADYVGASGFMAVFTAGLVLGNLDAWGWTVKENHHDEVRSFIHIASFLLRIVIFILLGTQVDLAMILRYIVPATVVVAVFMLVARPVAVLVCTGFDRRAKWQKNEILFMFWTRETGVIPAALAGMLSGAGIGHADIISAVTFLAILATLLIQATSTPWLARKLGLLVPRQDMDILD